MSKRLERKGWNWAAVPSDVILSQHLTHADVRVYAYLLWRAGNKGAAWPKADTVAVDLKMSNASVRLSYRHLISENWIRRLRQVGRASTTYIFETQKECLAFSPSANRLADEQLTGEPSLGQQDSRLNENKGTRIKERARENHSRTSEIVPITPTKEIQQAYEQLIGYSLNGEWAAGEGKAAKEIAQHYTVAQLEQAYRHYKADKFWQDKRLPLRYLKTQMPELFRNAPASPSDVPDIDGSPSMVARLRARIAEQEGHK
jgi:hypothetical protein